jgi:hypothetical protein
LPNREPSHEWLGYCQRWQTTDDEAAPGAPEEFAFRQVQTSGILVPWFYMFRAFALISDAF